MIKNKRYFRLLILLMTTIFGLFVLSFYTYSEADSSNNQAIVTVEYEYKESTNTVIATIKSNTELQGTKATWTFGSDKKSYSFEFNDNTTYTTKVTDIYGNVIPVQINVTQVKKQATVHVEYEYKETTNTVIATIKSDIQLQSTKATWTFSSDKKSYTFEFNDNTTYTTKVTDIYGNTIPVQINVTQVKKQATVHVEYEYKETTNTVIATIKSDIQLQSTKATWTYGTDKKSYSFEFNSNTYYTTKVTDIYGNVISVQINVTQVIEKKAVVYVEYEYKETTNTVIATIKSDIQLQSTKATWTFGEDKKSYSFEFNSNTNYTTKVTDIYGNVIPVQINVTQVIEVNYEYRETTNTVLVTIKSNIGFKNTKTSWKLSDDKKNYTFEFNDNTTYITTVEDIEGHVVKLQINVTQVKKSAIYDINTSKYPGYKELLEKLQKTHPTWNFELLYTGLNFNTAVYGEYSIHNANLVPTSSGSEWICPVCGTKLYDTGWYGASDKAIAYYMDPRNFLNDSNIFQFLDANKYETSSVSIEGIQTNVNGTFLQNYASDINTACRNQGVNPYYVISRLIQENGKNGSTTSRGMNGGNGKIYYNPFNIGATGNSTSQVIANALAKAKAYGWDTMEKALEGGIVFLKANWLDNYQNTLYQNRFDIDSTNGTSLYSHQYMQNLSAAYSEGNLLRGYYVNAGKVETNLTFIIPMYEGMSATLSPKPSEGTSSEEYPINVVVNTSSSTLALRSGANTSSTVIARYAKGTVLLSIQRGINSTWQHVVTKDGNVGYMSGEYLKQVNDEYVCNYKAYVKTQSSGGLSVRTGPSTKDGFSKVEYLPDYTQITVIDDSTYKGYEGTDWVQWSRIILSDGRQAFVPSSYVKKY